MTRDPGGSADEPLRQAIRGRFPVLSRKIYLNSCSCGALASDVIAAFEQYVDDRMEKGSDWDSWVAKNEAARDAVAGLLGAGRDEIAVTASASAGINAVASSLDFSGTRNKVVISDFEFPTNAQIWYAQERRGAKVQRVAEQDGAIPLERFEAAIDEETLIVAVTHVCYRNGVKLDVAAIAEIARRKGALLLVDGYQSVGTCDFDVRRVGADFVVGGMVKYLLGTAGIGFLYARRELADSLVPTVTGWFAQEDIPAMDVTGYHPAAGARRFEAGTPPVVNCYAAVAGLGILAEYGMAFIEQRIAELTATVVAAAREAGYTLATPEAPESRGALVALRTHDEETLVSLLAAEDIVTSSRSGNLRISPHFYNEPADVDAMMRALAKHRHLLV